MDVHTALIVPAVTDQAGQCRIVARQGLWPDALQDYRANSSAWKEVGLMSSQGRLVYASNKNLQIELLDGQPLMAGLTVAYDEATPRSAYA